MKTLLDMSLDYERMQHGSSRKKKDPDRIRLASKNRQLRSLWRSHNAKRLVTARFGKQKYSLYQETKLLLPNGCERCCSLTVQKDQCGSAESIRVIQKVVEEIEREVE